MQGGKCYLVWFLGIFCLIVLNNQRIAKFFWVYK